jgi:hypothetical protein
MQKLINGKLYDTDEAEKVARYSTGGSTSDFSYYRETLYRTDNDRWFLHGEGHAKTRYASTNANGMKGWGTGIRALSEEALSEEEAFQWCQRKGKVETAQEHFADHIEPA